MKKEVRTILRRRAEILARVPEPEQSITSATEIVEFIISSGRYGIEVSEIREVYSFKDYTPLPGAPPFIKGVLNVRGQIIPAIAPDIFFGLPDNGIKELDKAIILGNNRVEAGLLIGNIIGTRRVPVSSIHEVPPLISVINRKYLAGITDDNTLILNGLVILEDERLIVNEGIN